MGSILKVNENMEKMGYGISSSLLASLLGGEDEKENRSLAFDHDRYDHHAHSFPSDLQLCFYLSAGMSVLRFFWHSEVFAKKRSSCFYLKNFGWETSFAQ